YGNGMMAKVIRPDNTEVTFKYDSLGRRIEKSSDDKTMRFVWDGNTILHEFLSENDSAELENDNLITWIFNDGFVPSAKITSKGNYSIISDYLGTPVEAYDGEGNRVWSAELDIYGRVKEFTGTKDFIPFRYQGQYEDVEIGFYYNRFRYYDPEQGNYTQPDPIGLEGKNPTLYGYVQDTNKNIDKFGLYSDLLETGMGHHLMPRSIAKALGITELSQITSIAWYPDKGVGTADLHKKLHRELIEEGIPYHGSKFTGTVDEFFEKAAKAYQDIDVKGYLKIPYTDIRLFENLTPAEALDKIKELHSNGKIPCK
ncbi:RHS repeat domain-containing protein, partial [Lysinibacillus xylanilyticus]|uniref:RHS repeat domain-containing protein n=1 Tax=Lysinibacillus xylanilyticus TaxID=582475 RepID=UPI003D00664B